MRERNAGYVLDIWAQQLETEVEESNMHEAWSQTALPVIEHNMRGEDTVDWCLLQ